ncbi:hypothetical protein V8C35DRAFT_331124 [Trichoderma chlorosporum]
MRVLLNRENLRIKLYEQIQTNDLDMKSDYLIVNRVEELYETLEKIIDYQKDIAGKDGKLLENAPRKDLEGWDFKDIATKQRTIEPRLAKIKTIGKGWIDFTRTLQAATLFGGGFGELIKPTTASNVCSYWSTLPSNKYYLAASMDDLKRIMERLGDLESNPPQLTQSQAWIPYAKDSSPSCECGNDTGRHCELTQTIWPLRMAEKHAGELSMPSGAVIFGHHSRIGKIWKDIGDPEDGIPPSFGEESDGDDPKEWD